MRRVIVTNGKFLVLLYKNVWSDQAAAGLTSRVGPRNGVLDGVVMGSFGSIDAHWLIWSIPTHS